MNAATKFLTNLKRHYYVTPTSYLELISTFKKLLGDKREEILGLKDRYENGYECLITTEAQVSKMQKELEELKPKLVQTSKLTDEKMVKVAGEKAEADKIAAKVSVEEAAAQKIADQVSAIKEE